MTPAEKQFKKNSAQLLHARNRTLVEFATKRLTSYEDLLVALGHDRELLRCYYPTEQLNKPTSRQQIFEYFNNIQVRYEQLRDSMGQQSNPTTVQHDYEGCIYPPLEQPTVAPIKELLDEVSAISDDVLKPFEQLPPSPNQKCILFPFQERAAAALYHGIINYHKPNQLLRAAVGTGKTYIIGAVADRLRNDKFCEGKTFAPWPMLYVTKATIIQQTERVFQQQFGLDTINTLRVINIEQLRASLGELMVRCESIVHNGEEQLVWKWREGVHPIIFFFDECQILKNEDSQQSQIVQAISDLKHPNIHCIFFSATPFLRVIDVKCFVLNCRMEVAGYN